MKQIKAFLFLLPLLFIGARDISDTVVFSLDKYNPTNAFKLENAVVQNCGNTKAFRVKDLTYANNSSPYIHDLILAFNKPCDELIKDDTRKYNISKALYSFADKKALGGGCAAFFKTSHAVEIQPARNLWLGNSNDLGSFTIDFRFYAAQLKDRAILFSRAGYISGEKNGIEIMIKDKHVIVYLHKIFENIDGRRYDIILNGGMAVTENRWHHFSLSFDRISGKLSRNLDGREQEALYVSEEGIPYERVHKPSFFVHDFPPAVIGKNFIGYIDEFRISYADISAMKKGTVAVTDYNGVDLVDRAPLDYEGIVTSPVCSFDSTGTAVTLFNWQEVLKNNTFIWMEFRISDYLFDADDTSLKWYRIENKQKNIYLKQDENGYVRGKYYQWRAHLVPSPDGAASPYLCDVELGYQIDKQPSTPMFFETISAGDKTVRLRWKKNVEFDILGYKIYYGIVAHNYSGIIGTVNGKRITNDFNQGKDYIEIELTNDVIDENKTLDKKGILDYPYLKNNSLYYFSICAYDNYRPDTPYNHESACSKEAKARPFAGSEISDNK